MKGAMQIRFRRNEHVEALQTEDEVCDITKHISLKLATLEQLELSLNHVTNY